MTRDDDGRRGNRDAQRGREGIEHDPLLIALSDARPEPHDRGDIEPDEALLANIVATGRARSRRRLRRAGAAVLVAAALTVALVAVQMPGARTVDIALVASRSVDALRGSGRAQIESVTDRGLEWEQRAATSVTFDGDDVEMVMDFAGERGRPGFTAHNRTVDGEFYLLDGPPGAQRWVHDTGARTRGSDLFSLDPRTLCGLLKDSAEFEFVDETDGVKHLRATSVDDLPPLSFGAGPSDARAEDVTRLELWVGPDDVVQRIDLDLEREETTRQGGETILVPRSDGRMHKMVDPNTGEMVTTTHRSSYSVRFFDVGEPVEIVAPEDAVAVAGKG